MPRPHINHEILIEKCAENFSGYWGNPITFDDIYIESGDKLILLNQQKTTTFNIVDLW